MASMYSSRLRVEAADTSLVNSASARAAVSASVCCAPVTVIRERRRRSRRDGLAMVEVTITASLSGCPRVLHPYTAPDRCVRAVDATTVRLCACRQSRGSVYPAERGDDVLGGAGAEPFPPGPAHS